MNEPFKVHKPPIPPKPDSEPINWQKVLTWVAGVSCFVLSVASLWGHFLLYHLVIPSDMTGGDFICSLSAFVVCGGLLTSGVMLVMSALEAV